jgi:ABC-type sugar transport system ATPase subunit
VARVDFEHVEKRYGKRAERARSEPQASEGRAPAGGAEEPALADLCLSVADGELLAVVGPSGCGKSTLLRLLAGLETPTRGTIRLDGEPVDERSPRERNVAMVFQDYALYPHRTVRGNLAFPLEMRRAPRDEIRRRVEAVAELLGIAPLLERRPAELSGGERQRVAMGRALVREPSVFLLDEPLSNLDAKLRVHVRAEIAELQRRTGTTMLYVTHDQVEALTLGERVAVLHQGRLQQVASPRELYARPANLFVAGFIGSPPMNLLATRLGTGAGGRAVLELAGRSLALPDALAPAARAAGALTLGVRPEAIRVVRAAAEAGLRARVLHLEFLGHEILAHLALGADAGDGTGPRVVARLLDGVAPGRGEAVDLAVDPADLHLFGGDGRALAPA